VLWIREDLLRIRSSLKAEGQFNILNYKLRHYCESRSGRIGIILADPDRLRFSNMCKNLGLDPDPDRHRNGKSDPDGDQTLVSQFIFWGDKKTSVRTGISLKSRITGMC
jgi:hypothetical protein